MTLPAFSAAGHFRILIVNSCSCCIRVREQTEGFRARLGRRYAEFKTMGLDVKNQPGEAE
jgi:hypothetical protein